MIKNTIIVILLLLLLITFYAYMCLSSNMIDFQKERMTHIVKKEKELKLKEQKLISMTECNENLNKYKLLVNKITSDLAKTTNEMNLLSKYTIQANNSINNDINQLNQQIQPTLPTQSSQNNTTNIVLTEYEIPSEKLEQMNQSEKIDFENFENFENFQNINEVSNLLDLPIEDGFLTGLDK